MIQLSDAERKILLDITMNGPSFGGPMSRRTGLSKGTISEVPRSLEKRGLVSHIIALEPRARKYYSLTVAGLVQALSDIRSEERQSVMKAWPDLIPLVTDKWDFFVGAGVEDLALKRIETTVREMLFHILIDASVIPIDQICTHGVFSACFYRSKIGTHEPNLEDQLRWAKVCRDDPDILKYFIRKLNAGVVMDAAEIVMAEKMLDTLEDNKGKRKPILSKDFIMRRLPPRGTPDYRSTMSHLFHRAGISPPQPFFSKIMNSNPEMSSEAYGHTLQSDSET